MNEQLIPEAAFRDENAVEMPRVWIAERGLHCAIKVGMYAESKGASEENAWGTVLADVIRHLADALQEGYGKNRDETIQKISAVLIEELGSPSSKTAGEFIQKH